MSDRFESLSAFYPYYLGEHKNGTCRALHFFGSSLVLTLLGVGFLTSHHGVLWFLLIAGYGPAWAGHFFFEKNRPATFQYPLYSFVSDWLMFKDILIGRVPLFGRFPKPS
jgi:hypothetical protein